MKFQVAWNKRFGGLIGGLWGVCVRLFVICKKFWAKVDGISYMGWWY